MYCPRCAAQNLDDAKFCRGCGTGLETVALALAGRLPSSDDSAITEKPRNWIEERQQGIRQIVKASGLLGSSLLIGAALGLFSNTNDWIIIWLVFVGWMACWGMIALFSGIGSLMEARFMRQQLEQSSSTGAFPSHTTELVTGELIPSRLAVPLSVTEHTTKSLSQKTVKSEE